jgi:hypothetical protein
LAALMLSVMPMPAALAAQTATYATLHASEPPIASGQGRIYLYRESGLMGVAIQPTIMINCESTGGRAKLGDYRIVIAPPGAARRRTTYGLVCNADAAFSANARLYPPLP